MSKDDNRVNYILHCIRMIWQKYPQLRLGQIFANCGFDLNTLYYINDTTLIKHLSNIYKIKLPTEEDYIKSIVVVDVRESKPSDEASPKSTNRGRVYVHKGEEVRSISKDELDHYLNDLGFSIGKKDRK